MSAIIVMPVLIPAATAAWPVLATAAAAAATSLGFAVAPSTALAEEEERRCVDVELTNAEALTQGMNRNEQLVFERNGAIINVHRNQDGRIAVKVMGQGAEEELRAIGQEMSNALVRQYAYHQLVTELKQREFALVDEATEDDGTIRLRVRAFR